MSEKKKYQPSKTFSFQGFDNMHYRITEQYVDAVDALFGRATMEISLAALQGKYNPNKPFSFVDYPRTHAKAQDIINNLANNINSVVNMGSTNQWIYACKKNDAFLASILDTSKVAKALLDEMQDRNLDALQTFQKRKVDGLDLSQRVWKYVDQYKDQIELGLDVGLGDGRSAQQLSRDLKENLQDPDRLFRRVRDKRGNLQLSKAAKAFHPGQGVYRSSSKNAARVTRSEINMSYRESDWLRWQGLEFVVGFNVQRSNREPRFKCKLCDSLVGRYPKSFKFKGWHPQCMCFATAILMDMDEFNNNELSDLKAALRGGQYKKLESKNKVTDVPQGFKDWVALNTEKQANWKSSPYFIRDNFKDGLMTKGLKYIAPIKKPKPIKTEQQKADIQARWNKRKELMAANATSKLDSIIEAMKNANIDYNDVKLLSKKLSDLDIISRVGGGDLTGGSCSSLAFAYAGNKSGLDVLDFRGGESAKRFSSTRTIMDIAEKVGGVVNKHTNDFTNANALLKKMSAGKEYYFTCGKHAAIVRKAEVGFEYLELQSAISNGFKPLTTAILKRRFGAQKSHTFMGEKYETSECIIDIELLKNNAGFKKLLGYINTAESSQIKGVKGTMK